MRKYVTMLDDRALLITFKAKNGEVAAADMIEKAEVTIVLEKNAETNATISEDPKMNELIRKYRAQEAPVMICPACFMDLANVPHASHRCYIRLCRKIISSKGL